MRFNVNAYVAHGRIHGKPGSVIVNALPNQAPARHSLALCILVTLFALCSLIRASEFHAGPLFDHYSLTLAPGSRTEVLGPLFYSQQKESEHIWAIPPLFSYTREPESGLQEYDFCYPILTYDRYGPNYRWQLLQVISFAGGPEQEENGRHRFALFPIYFQQRSDDPSKNYTAVFPFYGHLKNRLFRDRIFFVMWPIYSQTVKHNDIVTDNVLVPIFSVRHGDGLYGWQFWPVVGNEHKEITKKTNGFGDVLTDPEHDSFFLLWPLYLKDRTGLGTTNPASQVSSLPAFSILRSPMRDSTTIIWPFFSRIDDREKKYREWDFPWPLVEFVRGEGKTTSRVWPFFSQSHNATLESDFYLWPIYKYNRGKYETLDRQRTRIIFFLYSDITDANRETGRARQRRDLWPLFLWKKDFNGDRRLQLIAPLEVFVPGSHKIERDYSPIWSVWRSDYSPQRGASSQSLLWNLYRHQTDPNSRKCSLLFGLFQYQSGSDGKRVRLFYIPLVNTKAEKRSAMKSESR